MESTLLAAAGAWGRLGQSVWYALIAVSAAVFLLFSLLLGHDHDADHDVDHDVDHDHDADHEGSAGMSFFSTKVLLMFATGFGAGGYFATRLDAGSAGSAVAGLGVGLAMAAAGYLFLNALYTRQGSSTVRMEGLVGREGIVDVTIDGDRPGQVACSLPTGREIFTAYSAHHSRIPVGTSVRITAVTGASIHVEPIER
jgi:membrane protein implicated in regulation of membrane protease activity